jgi:hypothetical protein
VGCRRITAWAMARLVSSPLTPAVII